MRITCIDWATLAAIIGAVQILAVALTAFVLDLRAARRSRELAVLAQFGTRADIAKLSRGLAAAADSLDHANETLVRLDVVAGRGQDSENAE